MPGTLRQEYAQGPMVVLEGWAVSCERGTPVTARGGPALDQALPGYASGQHVLRGVRNAVLALVIRQ